MNASKPLFSMSYTKIISVSMTVCMVCQPVAGATTGSTLACAQAKDRSSQRASITKSLQSEACATQALKAVVLPAARVGKAYRPRLLVQGGQPPYEMQAADAQFSATGLIFTREGMLMGTPKASGKFEFRVTTLDASGASATQRFLLEILPAK